MTHKTGQPHPTAAKQIALKIFLDPTSQNADGAHPYWGFECYVRYMY